MDERPGEEPLISAKAANNCILGGPQQVPPDQRERAGHVAEQHEDWLKAAHAGSVGGTSSQPPPQTKRAGWLVHPALRSIAGHT